MRRRFLITLLAVMITPLLFAQFYSTGQDPASYKWRQIKTTRFIVVYPDFAEKQAQQSVCALESAYARVCHSYGTTPKRITVILHPADMVSNAMVPYAPRRIEYATTPPQDNYPQDWLDQLAIHEYRHVVQYAMINRGMTRVLSWIFGEQVVAAVFGTFVPFWYIEGDATLTETLLSESGRGRQPLFDATLRAQLLEKGAYSYNKAVFGSYRDFVPDHYVLGYHLVTMARSDYGMNVWNQAMNKAGRCPVMITPFNRGIRETTGLSKVRLYRRVMHQLDSIWQVSMKNLELTQSKTVTPPARHYTSYTNPALLAGDRLVAVKSGINDINRIVSIDSSRKARKLCTPGAYSDFSLSARQNLIAWSELTYDPRWENRNWSVIRCYDTEKNRRYKLSRRSRYFSPAVSPTSREVAVVECDMENTHSLVFLDAVSGDVQHRIVAGEGLQIISPSWSPDGSMLVCILLGKKGKQLALAGRNGREFRPIAPASRQEISKPVFWRGYILFSAAYSGIDNIYAMDTAGKTIFRITSVRFGAYSPCVAESGQELYYSECTADGYVIAKAQCDTLLWVPVTLPADTGLRIFEALLPQESGLPDTQVVAARHASRPYRKFMHLLHFHSWGPISVDANSATVRPGFTLMTQNKLSTLFGTLGYEYNLNEGSGTYFADISFRQWYPVFDVRFETGNRHSTYQDSMEQSVPYTYGQTSLNAGLRIPLNLSSGKFIRWLQPRVSTTWMQITPKHNAPANHFKGFVWSMDYDLYASFQMRRVARDLHPRWGQSLRLNFRHTPFEGYDLGQQLAGSVLLYFPGIGKHHSLFFGAGLQSNSTAGSWYNDLISYPRGIRDAVNDEFWSLSANYTFPLCYPDLSLGSVIYLKRLWMNIYYDHAEGRWENQTNRYSSTGIELNADLHVFRFLAPFTLGGRLNWIPSSNTLVPEFLYSLNIDDIR